MAGAAIWCADQIVGVVSSHQYTDGRNRVTATDVASWYAGVERDRLVVELTEVLGLPSPRIEDVPAIPPGARRHHEIRGIRRGPRSPPPHPRRRTRACDREVVRPATRLGRGFARPRRNGDPVAGRRAGNGCTDRRDQPARRVPARQRAHPRIGPPTGTAPRRWCWIRTTSWPTRDCSWTSRPSAVNRCATSWPSCRPSAKGSKFAGACSSSSCLQATSTSWLPARPVDRERG